MVIMLDVVTKISFQRQFIRRAKHDEISVQTAKRKTQFVWLPAEPVLLVFACLNN